MQTIELASKKLFVQVASLLLLAILLTAFTSLSWLALSGALFSLFILNKFIFGFGEGIPVNIVMVFMACLQWIIGPILSYYTGINHPFYGMQVPEEYYFSFILPGVILYYLGLSLPLLGVSNLPKLVLSEMGEVASNKQHAAYYLISIGFVSSFAQKVAPGSLFFFLYLLSQLKYIGCFYLYFNSKKNNTLLYVIFGTLALDAVVAALFHDLILWGIFFLFIYSMKNKVSLSTKYSALIGGLFFLLILQSVKYQYRSIAWSNASLSAYDKSELFLSMAWKSMLSSDILFATKTNELSITRLNQGWIITRVMNYVPAIQPFADGETIEGAFSAALLPRFLAEDKAKAGGRYMMLRFTGIDLQETTSMNISLIGEAYGNYGRKNGIWFMLLIGIVFSLVLRFIFTMSRENPTILFWIPFLFLQVVKAETDLTTTLNYVVKATIVMLIIFYGFRKVLKIEL
jgi:hypothetical protein